MIQKKKKFRGGWEFDYWDETASYPETSIVYYEGYLYRAATATSPGDNPLTSTHSFVFYDTTYINSQPGGMDSQELVLPKWVLWDLGTDYYHGMLRGIYTKPFDAWGRVETSGIRTLVVRQNFIGSASTSSDEHYYENAISSTYEGYGFPAGMDSEWEGGLYAPSMVDYGGNMGGPASFYGDFGNVSGLIYQPTAFLPVASYTVFEQNEEYYDYASAYWDNGGLASNPTLGGVFAVAFSIGVTGSGSFTVAPLSDVWTEEEGTGAYDTVTSVNPNPATG